ncbi:hypothetical protein [Pelargonium vein banding virus]|uniref:hypothetical protein n=1 Tax=Pelargonium vein banding virus TaxID=671126 RepID=UPI0001B72006|nr:hypothetical protein [Pelargonium vein banding virus]ACV74336.1 unknown [Pelargonium vein banding virus]
MSRPDSATTAEYIAAAQATEALGSPAEGFLSVKNIPPGSSSQTALLIKQNNFLLELVLDLHRKINGVEARLSRAKEPAEGSQGQGLEEIIQKLDKLKIGDGEQKTHSIKGPGKVYFYRDPKALAEEERRKAKLRYA